MTKTILSLASLPVLALLAACSSGGSNGGGSASFNDMARDANALLAKYDDAEPTPILNMPENGSATYRGVAAYSDVADMDYIAENAEIMSDVELNASFASGSLTGELSNFRAFNNDRIAGTVKVQNGSIDGNEIYGDLAGDLSYQGERASVDGVIAGMFVGRDAQAIAGAIGADVGGEEIYGMFGAER
mgnify:CR=1 FL=1